MMMMIENSNESEGGREENDGKQAGRQAKTQAKLPPHVRTHVPCVSSPSRSFSSSDVKCAGSTHGCPPLSSGSYFGSHVLGPIFNECRWRPIHEREPLNDTTLLRHLTKSNHARW